jgi:hypothetical protein
VLGCSHERDVVKWTDKLAERERKTIYAGQVDIFGNVQPETVHLDERVDAQLDEEVDEEAGR